EQVRQRGRRQSTRALANTASEERRSDVRHCRTGSCLYCLLLALLLFLQPRLSHLGRGPEQSMNRVLLHLTQKLRRHLRQFRQSASRQRRGQEASTALHQVRAHVVALEERVDAIVVPAAQSAGDMTAEAPHTSSIALDLLCPVDGV